MFLVEFRGLRGIVGDECNMPDASHLPSSLEACACQKRGFCCVGFLAGYRQDDGSNWRMRCIGGDPWKSGEASMWRGRSTSIRSRAPAGADLLSCPARSPGPIRKPAKYPAYYTSIACICQVMCCG